MPKSGEMSPGGFFEKRKPASAVKTEIVLAFFKAWAAIGVRNGSSKLAYLDFFAGKGTYDEGEEGQPDVPSTPLRILEAAIENPDFASRLASIFNDADRETAGALSDAITQPTTI